MESTKSHISLFELNKTIQFELKNSFSSAYWVVAEINELKVNYSRHCYLELIEKEKSTDAIIAKARATIWAGTYSKLLPYFETTAQHAFCEGIKVMVRATVEFHELYGLSLNIIDIDPVYTVGDLQQQRQETIEKLKKEGVFQMNKELELPVVTQRIAIISSEKAAGFGDFVNQLKNNSEGFKFYFKLFPTVMQGENAEQSIIEALEKIYRYEDFFEAVIIIRGGGSKSDLSCFDKYWLAYHVAQFPLPVLTGIGHEQDDTVVDMVAHTRLKTPTAVAAFLTERAALFENELNELFFQIKDLTNEHLVDQQQKLIWLSTQFHSVTKLHMAGMNENLNKLAFKFQTSANKFFQSKRTFHAHILDTLEGLLKNLFRLSSYSLVQHQKMLKTRMGFYLRNRNNQILHNYQLVSAFDLQNVLNRGFSITMKDGKVVKDSSQLNTGDEINTRLKKGNIISKITRNK